MIIRRTKEELKSLNIVANNSNLSRIFLLRSGVERSIDANTYDQVNGQIEFEGDLIENEKEYFNAKVSFTAKGLSDEGKDIVAINCEYVLSYVVKANTELFESDLSNFCNTNAIYNAWPYVREFVQSICDRMAVPAITLPLLRIVPERSSPTGKKAPSKKKQ